MVPADEHQAEVVAVLEKADGSVGESRFRQLLPLSSLLWWDGKSSGPVTWNPFGGRQNQPNRKIASKVILWCSFARLQKAAK